ncbi:class I SAM-dependent methyltransferase [Salidesulfovibrio brasiliensis]|uniref:class I SAM-dependent methyltransferase n=1 Tax=Salidesulfovibrio brasiliensis TaxID=221711 RepID=UPI0006D2B026|nr:class I SAM-dependent methyltransferase [Salidesulfovibrio brasiliensis]
MTSEQDRRAAFAERMVDILNASSLNLALALGYRTRLFEAMDGVDEPQSASELANAAGMSERYVREWLGVMVAGRVIELHNEDDEERFLLPPEHADILTRRAGSSNLGVYTQEIPLLTQCAMDGVLKGFVTGEGLSYDTYPRFQQFMGELADAKHMKTLVEDFLPSVDGGRMVERLRSGIRVLDMGCAEGLALRLMAAAFPESEFVGLDCSEEAIHTARLEAGIEGLDNTSFELRDVADPVTAADYEGAFDYVTAFDAVHDQRHPAKALDAVHRMLAPGGAFSMVDIAAESDIGGNAGHPMGPFLYTVSLMHCMPVGLHDGGAGLGMMWGRQRAERMLAEAGFSDVNVTEIPNDPFNLHFFCRP